MIKRGHILVISVAALGLFTVLSIEAQQNPTIPNWIRDTALWWGEGKISDSDFINAMQYLMNEKILNIPSTGSTEESIDKEINFDKLSLEITGIEEIVSVLDIQQSLIDSNKQFEEMQDVNLVIEQRDKDWTDADWEDITPFMQELIDNKVSKQLRELANNYQESFGYDLYPEIFVTNAYGVNVAQTGKTSDYLQSDELWWERARQEGLYISEVHYDQSADVYSADISLRINGKQGEFLGVIKAVTNVDQIYKPAG